MAGKIKTPKNKNLLRDFLRKCGYKATPPRLAIFSLFKENSNPMSAQKIIDALPVNADQATVYRTLKSLKEKGIIKQIDLRHNHAHYELADVTEHHHLICLRCGRIEDIHHCDVEAVQVAAIRNSKHFAEIKQHALEFYGICKKCVPKNQPTSILPPQKHPLGIPLQNRGTLDAIVHRSPDNIL